MDAEVAGWAPGKSRVWHCWWFHGGSVCRSAQAGTPSREPLLTPLADEPVCQWCDAVARREPLLYYPLAPGPGADGRQSGAL